MLAAGCAVGLGNVWRFPYVVGENGGAVFVLVYLFFLLLFGLPVLLAELAIGRGAKAGIAGAFSRLGGKGWGYIGTVVFTGNLLLMVYYTDVAGWLLSYTGGYAFSGEVPVFSELVSDKAASAGGMVAVVVLAAAVCSSGVQKGVERISKWMMLSLLLLMIVLACKAIALEGGAEGLGFYLKPDWSLLAANPGKVMVNAAAQAFFTLSTGVGAMTIFGSYIGRNNSLVKESVLIVTIDTFVAITSGLVVFPACTAYGVAVDSGPGLIFSALPKVFEAMPSGRFWGFVFFLFLSLAALTTVIAVFECLIGGILDWGRWRRLPTAIFVGVMVALFSLPCVCFEQVLEWEDFVFSKVYLPLGALAIMVFVSWRTGWGWEAFRAEASAGAGPALPQWTRCLFRYVVPVFIVYLLVSGFLK